MLLTFLYRLLAFQRHDNGTRTLIQGWKTSRIVLAKQTSAPLLTPTLNTKKCPRAIVTRQRPTYVFQEFLFEHNRIPFGLMNTTAYFQRAHAFILSRYKWKTFLVYFDDGILFSASVAEHIENVDMVLNALNAPEISLKIERCEFVT